MIDHFGMPVSDIARATEFYLKALAPLGYGIVMQVSAEETGHGAAIGFGAPGKAQDFQSGKPSFWIGEGERRPHYHANYYGAFVLDLDGNNIEAVCHAPALN